MAHTLFPKGMQLALGAGLNLSAGTVKAALVRLDGTITDAAIAQVTGATNATPVVLSVTNSWTVGDTLLVKGVGGTTSANGLRYCSARAAGTATLQSMDCVNTVGNGAYTSGGCVLNVTLAQYYADISAAVIGTPVTLTTKTLTDGTFDCDPMSFTSVPAGVLTAVVVYVDTGNEATSPLVFIDDGRLNATVVSDASTSATTVWLDRIEGAFLSGETIVFSNGITATLTAPASAGARSVAVTAIAGPIAAGSNGDAAWENAAFPVTLGASSTVTVTPDPGSAFTRAVNGLFRLGI